METPQINNIPKPQDGPVVTLTDAAIEKIKSMQVKEQKEGYGLRVGVVTGGCAGLSYDLRLQKTPYDNDFVIEQKELKIFINPESLAFLKGLEIHYVDTLKESGFQYKNPNAKSSCGCGTSFS
jgi:iron-sulfur cluster assembly accessory protein